ncbi:hypothetical protein [Kineococcus sp. NPDC059986]|uniref:hypothetical protein n=1 Tax=Kineococcus sp. NPDC059986 TaxID=3155538 RepID=UPI00344C705D
MPGPNFSSAPGGDDEDSDLTAQQKIDAQELRTASPQQDRAETTEQARNGKYGGKGKDGKIHGMKQVKDAQGNVISQGNVVVSKTSVGQTKADWIRMTPEQRAAWGQHLVKLGIITAAQAVDPTTLAKYWSAYAEEAGAAYQAGDKRASPYSVSMADGKLISLLGGPDVAGGAGGIPDGDQKTSSQSFDITNPTEAASKIQDVFRAAFGREAAPGELSKLAASLQEAEYANPVTTNQVTTYKDGRAVNQKTTSTGGLDGNYYLTQKAKASPEYGAYQAATTYANELFKAIASPV